MNAGEKGDVSGVESSLLDLQTGTIILSFIEHLYTPFSVSSSLGLLVLLILV